MLVGEFWNLGAVARVLDRDAANVAVRVEIEQGIFVQVSGLRNLDGAKLDV